MDWMRDATTELPLRHLLTADGGSSRTRAALSGEAFTRSAATAWARPGNVVGVGTIGTETNLCC
jgi:hypothetical protein